MANTFPATPTPPLKSDFIPQAILKTTEFSPMPETHNWMINNTKTFPVITQLWEDGILKYSNGTGSQTEVIRWRIPILTDKHTKIDIAFSAKTTAGSGIVRVKSTGSGSFNDKTVDSTTIHYQTSISIAAIAATDYDEIYIEIGSTVDITILSFTAQFTPITSTSPIPASTGLVDDVEPIGTATFTDDSPISARTGRQLAEGINIIKNRPRVLYQWSCVSDAVAIHTGEPSGINRSMATIPHISWARINRGDDSELTFWARAQMQASSKNGYISGLYFLVPAGSGETWVQLHANNPTFILQNIEELDYYGPVRFARLYVEQRNNNLIGHQERASRALITSIVVWGK